MPPRALVLPTTLVFEASALMKIASHKANLALKAIKLVQLRALVLPEVFLVPPRALALIAGVALTSPEA